MGNYDDISDDELADALDDLADGDDDDLGAPARRRPGAGARPKAGPMRKAAALSKVRQALNTRRAAAFVDPERDYMCPFTEVTFAAASVPPLNATAQPQKRFVGVRLAIDVARTGASATGMVRLSNLAVGVDPQYAANGVVSAGNFAPTAVGTRLRIDASKPGITLTAALVITALPTTVDTVFVNTTLIGPTADDNR